LLVVSVGQGWAACLAPPLSPQSISQFKSNPQALIAPNSDTRTIEATTRDLAGSDASLAADLVTLAKGTTPRYQTAIAAGLAQAAIACGTLDQQAALLIQQAVADYQDGQFQASFAAVAGDLSTAATAAAAAYASSSAGSVVVTNPNASHGLSTNPGSGGTPTVGNLAILTTASSITPITPASAASTTAADAVSPTR
jgi:hypothetical protein